MTNVKNIKPEICDQSEGSFLCKLGGKSEEFGMQNKDDFVKYGGRVISKKRKLSCVRSKHSKVFNGFNFSGHSIETCDLNLALGMKCNSTLTSIAATKS